MSYYKSFGKIIGNPLYAFYLKWAYKKGVEDLKNLNFHPDFNKADFQCLLCGVGNEQTADIFIQFVAKRNDKAKIWIIDLEEEQITAVQKLVAQKYPNLDIAVKRMNALDLDKVIQKGTLDWIETDGFLEYFDSTSLEKLLSLWDKLLKPDGFITTRDFSTQGAVSEATDAFRIWLAKLWLGVTLFRHTKDEFTKLFKSLSLRVVEDSTPLPTYRRFAIIKQVDEN